MIPLAVAVKDSTCPPNRPKQCRASALSPHSAKSKATTRSNAKTSVSPVEPTAVRTCARLPGVCFLMQFALWYCQHDRDDRRHDHQKIWAESNERRFAYADIVLSA